MKTNENSRFKTFLLLTICLTLCVGLFAEMLTDYDDYRMKVGGFILLGLLVEFIWYQVSKYYFNNKATTTVFWISNAICATLFLGVLLFTKHPDNTPSWWLMLHVYNQMITIIFTNMIITIILRIIDRIIDKKKKSPDGI